MNHPSPLYASISLKAKHLTPAFHCDQAEGRVTVKLGDMGAAGSLYIDGTWDEIAKFAVELYGVFRIDRGEVKANA